jgi:hypothetical protein
VNRGHSLRICLETGFNSCSVARLKPARLTHGGTAEQLVTGAATMQFVVADGSS